MKILIVIDKIKAGFARMYRFRDCGECHQQTGMKCVLKNDTLSEKYIMKCEDAEELVKTMVEGMQAKQIQIPRFVYGDSTLKVRDGE